MNMLCAKHGSGQSVDCPVQTMEDRTPLGQSEDCTNIVIFFNQEHKTGNHSGSFTSYDAWLHVTGYGTFL